MALISPLNPFLDTTLHTGVLDGGLATELEAAGLDLGNDPLWSARCLIECPERIQAVHRAYFDAGADVAISASYQVRSTPVWINPQPAESSWLVHDVGLTRSTWANNRQAHLDFNADIWMHATRKRWRQGSWPSLSLSPVRRETLGGPNTKPRTPTLHIPDSAHWWQRLWEATAPACAMAQSFVGAGMFH